MGVGDTFWVNDQHVRHIEIRHIR